MAENADKLPNYVDDDGYDLCVAANCGKRTPYKFSTPVDMRVGYIEGAGQLCPECHKKIYGK